MKNMKLDIHAELMKKYRQVPKWWFAILLVGSIALSLLISFVYKEQVQLPWWGMIFAFALAWVVTLPIGVIQATTNQPGYDIIAQFIFGCPSWETHSQFTLQDLWSNQHSSCSLLLI
ncbi:Oligopeptide transporter 3 [Ancistrocladus abbreviatus]